MSGGICCPDALDKNSSRKRWERESDEVAASLQWRSRRNGGKPGASAHCWLLESDFQCGSRHYAPASPHRLPQVHCLTVLDWYRPTVKWAGNEWCEHGCQAHYSFGSLHSDTVYHPVLTSFVPVMRSGMVQCQLPPAFSLQSYLNSSHRPLNV